MGILDDAIREHLELKRSHGASEEELRRKEAEAFGPVRQDAAPAEPAVEEHTQLLSTSDEPVAAPEDPYVVHPVDHLVPDEDAPPVATHHDHDHDHDHDEQHPALVDHDHIGGEEHPPEPVFRASAEAPVAPPPDAPPDAPLEPSPIEDPPVGDPPIDPEIEEPPPRQSFEGSDHDHATDDADEDEDVLEETPEFLQDAPEHDRLWFEQKPPRDFDFGE